MNTRKIAAIGFLGAAMALTPMMANAKANLASGGIDAVGYTLTHNNYAEYSPTSGGYLDTEMGTLHGLTLTEQHMNTHLYLGSTISYVDGTTRYNGAMQQITQNGVVTTSYQGRSHSQILNWDISFGPSWGIGDRVLLAPIIGTNVYYWNRVAGDGAPGSVHERYFHWTVAAGLVGRVAITSRMRVQLLGEATYPIINVISTPYGGAKLGKHTGYRATLSVNYRVYGGLGLFARASLQYFKFGRANITGSGSIIEPDSRTVNTTYMVGLSYAY